MPLHSKKSFTSIYNPQCNNTTERCNPTIIQKFSNYVVKILYNGMNTIYLHLCIQYKHQYIAISSPYFILFGTQYKIPLKEDEIEHIYEEIDYYLGRIYDKRKEIKEIILNKRKKK